MSKVRKLKPARPEGRSKRRLIVETCGAQVLRFSARLQKALPKQI